MPSTARLSPSIALVAALGLGAIGLWAGAESAIAGAPSRAPGSTTVALVDLERVMQGLKEVKDLNAQVGAETDLKNKDLAAMESRIKKLDEEVKLLPADSKERRAKIVEGIELQKSYEAKAGIYKQLVSIQGAELMKDVYVKIQAAVSKMAQKGGYTLVLLDDRAITLPKTSTDREMNAAILSKQILFAADGLDVTDEIITQMNNEYQAPTGKN